MRRPVRGSVQHHGGGDLSVQLQVQVRVQALVQALVQAHLLQPEE